MPSVLTASLPDPELASLSGVRLAAPWCAIGCADNSNISVPTGSPSYRPGPGWSFARCQQRPGHPVANSLPISTRRSRAVLPVPVRRPTAGLVRPAKPGVRVDETRRAFSAGPASRRPDRGLSAIHQSIPWPAMPFRAELQCLRSHGDSDARSDSGALARSPQNCSLPPLEPRRC